MKIVWDLDGVIRDLNGHLMHLHGGPYPTKWDFCYNNKSIYDCVNENLDVLYDSPPTAYYNVLKGHYKRPEFWTSQPKAWRDNTTRWLDKYARYADGYVVRWLKCEEKEERLREDENILLVEDSPNFKSYDRIILIDRPYNQSVKTAIRVFGTKHLNNLIEVTKGV